MTIKVQLRFRLKERVVHSIGFTQKKDKLEFARRAGGQVVTSVVCNRSQPDPLGIVLWRDKLEFVGELGIDSLRRGRVSRPAPYKSLNSGGRETRPLRMDDDK